MNNLKNMLKTWVEDDNITLDDMYYLCEEKGLCNFVIETHEELRDFVKEMVDSWMKVAPLLASIEDNRHVDYYAFDRSSYSNIPATPINCKTEMAEAILGERLN